jgi:Mg-chelatase subunit ChlD/uncharacterized membrane protein
MSIAFDHPWTLLALLLALPLSWWGWRSLAWCSFGSTSLGLALRVVVLALLVLALAGPAIDWRSDAASVVVVMDTSASVPMELRTQAEASIRAAAAKRRAGDRLGVVTFANRPEVVSLPVVDVAGTLTLHAGNSGATDIAAALRMALAVVPADTATRILLVSDGNSTVGNPMEAAALAEASGVPIDVIPLRYKHTNEVIFERIAAPQRARIGQSIDLRMTLRSIGTATGRIELRQNDEPVDLDPDSDSIGFPVSLDPGANLVTIPAVTHSSGAQRFEATFVPDDVTLDAVAANNVGAAIVFIGGIGRVAIIQPDGASEGSALADALRRGSIQVEEFTCEQAMRGGLTWLAGFDSVVLANIPRWSVDNAFDRALHAYCHELGGGLVMLGGPESFGAGGWIGSETARAIPLRMDPPQSRVLLRASVALVIDSSGSMGAPVEATGMNQQEMARDAAIAGLRSLSRLDEATVIAFSGEPELVAPRGPIGDGTALARAVSGIQPCGGTNLFPALDLALTQLRASRAKSKHILVLTDGQTMGDAADGIKLARRARAEGITISTIGIGDGANDQLLQSIAREGEGRFHPIASHAAASKLPQVFIREMALEGRSLIEEGYFQPTVLDGMTGPLAGIQALPPLRGYVLAVPVNGLAQVGAMIRSKEGNDVLLAWQNYGVGRAVAFTSDLSGRWGAAWKEWSGFQQFSEQLMRWNMRPADDRSLETTVTVDGEQATVRVRSLQETGALAPTMRVEARLVDPNGKVNDLPLRQVGPGNFEGSFSARQVGAWMVSVMAAQQLVDGAARASTSHTAVNVPYAAEFRSIQDDGLTLRRIAERSGGRMIELDQVPFTDLCDRGGLTPAQSSSHIWDLLAMAAAICFVADVAWRRITFDRKDLQELTKVMTGGAQPTHASNAPPAETLANLRAARARARPGSS